MAKKQKGIRMEVEGIDALYAACRRLKGNVRKGTLNAVLESARAVEAEMLKRVPVKTGHLKSVINSRSDKRRISANVGPRSFRKAHYGYWQEFGTSKMKAQPFARPAADKERKKFPNRLRKALRKTLPR